MITSSTSSHHKCVIWHSLYSFNINKFHWTEIDKRNIKRSPWLLHWGQFCPCLAWLLMIWTISKLLYSCDFPLEVVLLIWLSISNHNNAHVKARLKQKQSIKLEMLWEILFRSSFAESVFNFYWLIFIPKLYPLINSLNKMSNSIMKFYSWEHFVKNSFWI